MKNDSLLTPDEPVVAVRFHRWSTADYYRLGDLGFFGPEERVELIRGEIVQKVSPQGVPHAYVTSVAADLLTELFGNGYYVRTQLPITLVDGTEPEPDIVVTRGSLRDSAKTHPKPPSIVLIVEVADSTVAFDRKVKSTVYAEAGIPEYWIVNVNKRNVEVFREPTESDGYASSAVAAESDTVKPLGLGTGINVEDLLPS